MLTGHLSPCHYLSPPGSPLPPASVVLSRPPAPHRSPATSALPHRSGRRQSMGAKALSLMIRVHSRPCGGWPLPDVTFEKVTSAFLLPFFHAFFRGKTLQNAICYFVTFSGRYPLRPIS